MKHILNEGSLELANHQICQVLAGTFPIVVIREP